MKLVLASGAFVFLLSAALFLATAYPTLGSGVVTAQSVLSDTPPEDEEGVDEQEQEDEDVSREAPAAYTYVAQPGDSYTLMARKAVQTYGIVESVDLSKAQIIFVETNLTQAAGSPLLGVDEVVDIEQEHVADWVERAGDLSESEEAAWASYADGVDFNTDSVGEASE